MRKPFPNTLNLYGMLISKALPRSVSSLKPLEAGRAGRRSGWETEPQTGGATCQGLMWPPRGEAEVTRGSLSLYVGSRSVVFFQSSGQGHHVTRPEAM